MNIKENQKYQATHQAIMSALLDALGEKNIKQVTVTELCRTVHINRSTFYEHFLDVYDVLEQIASRISAEVLSMAPKGKPTRENFLYLLAHIRENKDFYRLYFRQGLPLDIQNKFFLSEEPPAHPEVLAARGIYSKTQLEYHHTFFRAGLDAVVKKWLERDCAEFPEELFQWLQIEYQGVTGNAPRAEAPDQVNSQGKL